jgi:undecaprenyldiphospho-muramoylpentapeptide beta-N-acetylglucosaminyltransferase
MKTERRMRFLICAGGTGGGVYPALAATQALLSQAPESEMLWVGGRGGMEERLVSHAGLRLATIRAAGLHGVGLRQAPGNMAQLVGGTLQALAIMRDFRPHSVLLTGGYLAIPAVWAAKIRGVPVVVYVPDIEPAMAAKFAARLARSIAVTTETSRRFYPQDAPVTVTGYPLRREILEATRAAGRGILRLPAEAPVLLVFGGSRGARSINRALVEALPKLLEDMTVVHITGTLDYMEVEQRRNQMSEAHKLRYQVYPYLDEEMGPSLAAADLTVSRAGASILGEYPHFRLPSILVPYPHAWRYQSTNAEYLAKYGAADVLKDTDLSTKLAGAVTGLMKDAPRRTDMRAALEKLADKNGALKLAGALIQIAEEDCG